MTETERNHQENPELFAFKESIEALFGEVKVTYLRTKSGREYGTETLSTDGFNAIPTFTYRRK